MDVVVIFNGLGNQMSQYALYLSKKKIAPDTRLLFSAKSKNIHNGFELGNLFGIDYPRSLTNWLLFQLFKLLGYRKHPGISGPIIRLLKKWKIEIVSEDDDYNFHPAVLQPSKGIRFLAGGWHSEKYFASVKQEVRRAFRFDLTSLGAENEAMLHRIQTVNSVSVHVRRGDFMDADNFKKFGSVCTLNYFVRAIETIRSMTPEARFFFFTNDPQWVTEHFSGPDYTLVDINSGKNSWKDMFMISQCRHHINSNGSFSWWSAWLSTTENALVIVPKNFVAGTYFPDVYPDDWIRLSDY